MLGLSPQPPCRKRGQPRKISEEQAKMLHRQHDDLKMRFRGYRRPLSKADKEQLRKDGFSDPIVSLINRGKPAEAAVLHLVTTTKISWSTIAHKVGDGRRKVMALKKWAESFGIHPEMLGGLEDLSLEALHEIEELLNLSVFPPTRKP
jgi:hypothetical protein